MNHKVKYHFWILLSIVSVLFFEVKSQDTLVETNLPIIKLHSNGEVISADSSVIIDMGIIYNGPGELNYISDSANNYNGKIKIKKRGNTSLLYFPKYSYSVETQDSTGQNLNVSLIDLPEENDWVFYGPYSDKSLMRNVLIYELARRMGQYAPRTRYCELLLDGNYMGIYVLTEKIKRDDNRVNIAKLTVNDTIGDELTGGYIIKKDGFEGDGWTSDINWNIYFGYYCPDDDVILESQKNYIKEFINQFEFTLDTLSSLDDTTLTSLIDFNSFYDYIILNELSKNVDAYRRSTFMYKDKDSNDGRLVMGPIWDYNIAWGNDEYYNGYTTSNYIYEDTTFSNNALFWFRKLMTFPLFQENVNNRWTELRSTTLHIDSIYSIIDSCENLLAEAQSRNFTKWDILGTYVWPNYYIGDTYEEEIGILKEWIFGRLNWMDGNIITNISERVQSERFNIYPNPFKKQLTLRLNNTRIETLRFVLFDTFGKEIFRKDLRNNKQNQNIFNFDLSNQNLVGGFYFYHIYWNHENIYKGKLIKLK